MGKDVFDEHSLHLKEVDTGDGRGRLLVGPVAVTDDNFADGCERWHRVHRKVKARGRLSAQGGERHGAPGAVREKRPRPGSRPPR